MIGGDLHSRILFDISGLLQWYAYLRHPSGVQRVGERILQSKLIATSPDVVLIARAPGGEAFYRVEPMLIEDLARPDRRDGAIAQMRQQFCAMFRMSRPALLREDLRILHLPYLIMGWALPFLRASEAIIPQCGDVIVCLGDFWCHRGHVAALLRLKGRALLLHMVHDLFVLDHPEWSHPYFGQLVGEKLRALAPHVDRWLTTSRFVANELARFLKPRIGAIDLVPMGADLHASEDPTVLRRRGLVANSYILHVGTLEPRKNLIALVDAVERVPQACPLVLVGRDGWRSREIHRRLRRARKGVVHWIHDAADSELPSLYRGARFTVVPSFGEGWGLPVQESLAQGIPCIAARAGALPEVGGDLVRYVAPGDTDALTAAIADWSRDPAALADARRKIAGRAQLRQSSWDDAAAQVLNSVRIARSLASA
jgi:glycosyltransferase involved in cell wall biosynthesis